MTTSIEATLFTVELTHDVTTGEGEEAVTRTITELVQTFCTTIGRAIELGLEAYPDGVVVGVHNNGHQILLVDTGLLS